jgi:hypothetical protein
MAIGKKICLQLFEMVVFAVVLGVLPPATAVFAQATVDKPGASAGAKDKKAVAEKAKPPAGPAMGLGPKAVKAGKDDKSQAPPTPPGKGPKGEVFKGPKDDKGAKAERPKAEKGSVPEAKPEIPKPEEHVAMGVYLKNAAEHAKALFFYAKSNAQLSKELVAEHVEEIGRSLAAAKRHYAVIESAVAADAKMQKHHEAIKDAYTKASELYAALKTEAAKASPDPTAVKDSASGIFSAFRGAERGHKPMKAIHKVKEPTDPPGAGGKPAAPAKAAATSPAPAAPAKAATPAK